jgi:hypothetical protein
MERHPCCVPSGTARLTSHGIEIASKSPYNIGREGRYAKEDTEVTMYHRAVLEVSSEDTDSKMLAKLLSKFADKLGTRKGDPKNLIITVSELEDEER